MFVLQSHWGLDFPPFSDRPGREGFFAAEPHDEALARMHYVVDHGRRACIVEGDGGSGKTLLSRIHIQEAAERGYSAAWLNVREATDEQLRESLAARWGLPADQSPTWTRLEQRAVELMIERTRVVLALDDADYAAPEALEGVRSLLDRCGEGPGTLTIIATARSARAGRLRGRLYELGDLRVELSPWTLDDTSDFIAGSLERAGGHASLFEFAAVEQIHTLSTGLPRDICRLARLALLAGAGVGAEVIDTDMIDSVAEELLSA